MSSVLSWCLQSLGYVEVNRFPACNCFFKKIRTTDKINETEVNCL